MNLQEKEVRDRSIKARRAFRALYSAHKAWYTAYKYADIENLSELAQERDFKAKEALEAYRKADELLTGL